MKLAAHLGTILILAASVAASGNTFYVDPAGGSMAGDGSEAAPWSTLEEVFAANLVESRKPAAYPFVNGEPLVARNPGAPVKGGDTILLLSGNHGSIYLAGWYNTEMITIAAAEGHTPVLRDWSLPGGMNWTLRGLTISSEPYGEYDGSILVNFEDHNWNGTPTDSIVEDCIIYSTLDASAWTAQDWIDKTGYYGVRAGGDRITVRNCHIFNVGLGVIVAGVDSAVQNNLIEHIRADGIVGNGDGTLIEYNTVRYFYEVDGNHDDGIQLHKGSSTIPQVGVVVRGNRIDGTPLASAPLTHSPQGIGCFNGPYENCLFENNVVISSTSHALSVYRASGCTIINNTCLNPIGELGDRMYLVDSSGCIFRNNISSLQGVDPLADNTVDHNLLTNAGNRAAVFVDYLNGDVRLKAGSPAIDAGIGTNAPTIDIDGGARPFGPAWDIGAYEFGATAITPGDADGDGDVDLDDFVILKKNFGTLSGATQADGDFDGDGDVDLDDFVILKSNFGT